VRYGTSVGLVVAAGVLWSLQGLVFRQIEKAGSWSVLFWRSLGMTPVLLAFLVWRSGGLPWPAIRKVGVAGVLGGLGLIGAFGGAIYAIQATTMANAVFLFAASPFLAALLGWAVLRERVAPQTWGAMAIALAGIFVMVCDGLTGGALAGNVAALLSSLGFAVSLRWRRLDDTLPSVLLGSLFSILAGALLARQIGAGACRAGPGCALVHVHGRRHAVRGHGLLYVRQQSGSGRGSRAAVQYRGPAGPPLGLGVPGRDRQRRHAAGRCDPAGGGGVQQLFRNAKSGGNPHWLTTQMRSALAT